MNKNQLISSLVGMIIILLFLSAIFGLYHTITDETPSFLFTNGIWIGVLTAILISAARER